jgi:hypothetical protein
MADQFITCTTCGTQMPLTQALRADIEDGLKRQFARDLAERERQVRDAADARLADELLKARAEAARAAQLRTEHELGRLKEELTEQARQLEEARAQELALRRRERELERQHQDLELTLARRLDQERQTIAEEAQNRLRDEHRLKDAEKERQLADLRRQIEDLRRKAEQGSQQLQGEAGEWQLESVLRDACRTDDIAAVSQGVRGADLTHVVLDSRGARAGAILWECKNTRHWNDAWIGKLKMDQRATHADVAVLVTACLPKGISRFAYVEGVLVTDFASAAGLAVILRTQLIAISHARTAAVHKEERLELLHRYLTGTDFRHRVEALVEAFAQMRQDLDQERRAAERQWARRARQMEAVTLNVAGMYGDLQGLVPALPPIRVLQLPGADEEEGASEAVA